MPDIATALKAEIQRIARKEIRLQTEAMRKAATLHRREIAALKRQLKTLEQAQKSLQKPARTRAAPPEADEADGPAVRWSAKGFQSHRTRLGLSAEALGKLLGVSGQSVYNWEQQKSTPRAAQLRAIAALRTMSKRQAQAALTELE